MRCEQQLQQQGSSASTTSLQKIIDQQFQQICCLGHGGFGSVFLARKKSSGRQVALKFTPLNPLSNDDVEEAQAIWDRELDFVLQLDEASSSSSSSPYGQSIVFFEDWFTTASTSTTSAVANPAFACIVMKYADGGTLASEIDDHKAEPYTERRIAWYAMQLIGALTFAHQHGVAHQDVKSSNVLIDRSHGGGKLLLADWGSAIAPGEESIKMTRQYAPPELLRAVANDNLEGLEAEKIDSFGLGCILFELLSCQRQTDLMGDGDDCMAECIEKNGVEKTLNLPCVLLPWLADPSSPFQSLGQEDDKQVGYSHALKILVQTLLEGDPALRWRPIDLESALRQDRRSPLLAPRVVAAQPAAPGAVLTIDNIQLGLFVQRGPHWNDGDTDGGEGSIGVVVKLDADAGFTEVVFPSRDPFLPPQPVVCRIGSKNLFELRICPVLSDFVNKSTEPRTSSIVPVVNPSNSHSVGQMINDNCMIVFIDQDADCVMVAPMERIPAAPALPFEVPLPIEIRAGPRRPLGPPDAWDPDLGWLVEVTDLDERSELLKPFYAGLGGPNCQSCEILSIHRVQLEQMWNEYAEYRETIAVENWGICNEHRLFHGTGSNAPESLLASPSSFYEKCTVTMGASGHGELRFSASSKIGDTFAFQRNVRENVAMKQLVVSRVALGRVQDCDLTKSILSRPANSLPLEFHSAYKRTESGMTYTICNPFQAYPEYIITYEQRKKRRSNRFTFLQSTSTTSTTPSTSVVSGRVVNSSRAESTPLEHGGGCSSTPNATRGQSMTAPGSSTEGVFSFKECVVCQERIATHALVPCGHVSLCAVCSTPQSITKLKRSCPVCRGSIRETIRLFT